MRNLLAFYRLFLWRNTLAHKCLHHGHGFAHLVYCAIVAIDGTGAYAAIGGVLFVTTLAVMLAGEPPAA
jgi:hypothetical protein